MPVNEEQTKTPEAPHSPLPPRTAKRRTHAAEKNRNKMRAVIGLIGYLVVVRNDKLER